MGSSAEIGKQIINSLIQFISPNICIVCDNLIQESKYKFDFLCVDCYNQIPYFNPIEDLSIRQIVSENNNQISFDKTISLISTESNNNYFKLIHHLKYHKYRIIGEKLAEELAIFMKRNQFPEFDLIIPVPLHSAKKRERGYNQSDYIAKGISNIFSIPYNTKAVSRTVYTESQALTENASERFNFIKGAFKIKNSNLIENKRILICDDVYTTGSTLNSLASTIKDLGAKSVYVATIIATKSLID